MHDLTCLIKGCQARVYVPAGTHSICREHFLSSTISPGVAAKALKCLWSMPGWRWKNETP